MSPNVLLNMGIDPNPKENPPLVGVPISRNTERGDGSGTQG